MAYGLAWPPRDLSHNAATMNTSLVDSQSAVEDVCTGLGLSCGSELID